MSRKPDLVTTRKLPGIAPQLAELMLTRFGLNTICLAYKNDRVDGMFNLIRSELPFGVTDNEVREVANILNEKAGEASMPLPFGVPSSNYDIYLSE